MAQTGYTPIQLYRTTTVSAAPTAGNLSDGELAINTYDEKLYFKNSSGVVKLLSWNLSSLSTGIIKNTTGTGVPSIAVAGDFPTLNQNTTGTASNVTGTVAVANGGTGQTSYTDGQLLIGNSTGNTLTKATLTAGANIAITNSGGGISIAASTSLSSFNVYTSSTTWICPAGITKAKVTVVGAGGSAASHTSQTGAGGGGGGSAIKILTVTPGVTYTITIGTGGAALPSGGGIRNGNNGGSSSFSGPDILTVSATGGYGGFYTLYGPGGVGSGGDLNIQGGTGVGSANGANFPSSTGGETILCGRALWATFPTYGGGSGGGINDAGSNQGGNGVIILEY